LIGLWASNANFGDLIGTQIYKAVTTEKADDPNWGAGFFVSAAIVFAMAILNFLFLVEKPSDIGLIVEERGVLYTSQNNDRRST